MWKVYPVFSDVIPQRGWSDEDWDKLMRIVIAFCSRESPFAEQRNIAKRWTEIFEFFDIGANDEVKVEFDIQGRAFKSLMTAVFYALNDYDYQEWLSLKVNLSQNHAYLREVDMSTEAISKRVMLRKELPELNKRIMELEARIFQDEYLQGLIAEAAAEDYLAGYAEMFAKTPSWVENE